jgi:hypothetical protein
MKRSPRPTDPNSEDASLERQISRIRAESKKKVAALQEKVDRLVQENQEVLEASLDQIKSAIRRAGRKPCPDCGMTGALGRIDAGYMKRFGLPEWDGCITCGGEIGYPGKKGRGFI